MPREERFDSFYHATRHPLLLQAIAFTGDPSAAYAGVRHAYTSAWHHWDKVGELSDPLDWVRPRVWRRAHRRHRARLWRGGAGLRGPGNAVFVAVFALNTGQRRALLLTKLAGLSLPHAAAEMEVSVENADRLARQGAATFAAQLDITPQSIRERLLSLGPIADQVRLPRASMIRRAGSRRRSRHTLVASVAAVALAVGAGRFVYQPARAPDSTRLVDSQKPIDGGETELVLVDPSEPAAAPLSSDTLLGPEQISRLGADQDWRVERTHDNTGGTGINSACQQERFADPDGIAALVREFGARGKPDRSAVQTVEITRSGRQSRLTYDATVGWYAGCQQARFQLLDAYRVDGVGDEAQLLTARAWRRPTTDYTFAVARIGRVVTSTVSEAGQAQPVPPAQAAQSLDDAVSMLCAGSAASRDCTHQPRLTAVRPPPSGEEAGLLAVADLPPAGKIRRPWVGTDAAPARTNPAQTACDKATFRTADRARTRTYLIPGAPVPKRFGISETFGEYPSESAARQLLAQIRSRVARCEDTNEAAAVSDAHSVHRPGGKTESSVWEVTTEVSEDAAVRFRVGFVRAGDAVAQVTFSPTVRDDISAKRFDALVVRAGERLRELD